MKAARCLMILGLLLALAGCGPQELRSVPDELVGKWVTSSKKYADRFFELRKQSVVFATGNGQSTEHPVLSVAAKKADGMVSYVIHYSGEEGKPFEFSFSYNPVCHVILFTNQKEIEWKKDSNT